MFRLTIITIILSLLLHITSGQQIGSSCTNPLNQQGQCVALERCTTIVRLINEAPRPLSEQVRNFLQRSFCGTPSDRVVCCRLQDITQTTATRAPTTTVSSTNVQSHRNLNLLELRECGPVSSDRIAFGNSTVLYEFPWMALLGYEDNESLSPDWGCGGSVISRR